MSDEKKCQNCKHHSSGVAVVLPAGRTWDWEECTKMWSKPAMIGVVKNLCGAWAKK